MYLKYNFKKDANFEERITFNPQGKKFYTFVDKKAKTILWGKFYYFNRGKKTIPFGRNPESKLAKLTKRYNLEDFFNNIEGEYFGAKIDYKNKTLKIFSDKLKQLELYYFFNKDFFIIADDPKEIIDEVGRIGYEKKSLISALLLHLPKGHTLFRGIYRLKYNEIISIIRNKISKQIIHDKDIEIIKYSKKDLLNGGRLFKNAILSRASNKLNVVFSSGGWDSTLILAILKEKFGGDKVVGITMKITFSDGRCFNKFEIAKVKKIAQILGTKLDIIEMNYQKENLFPRIDEVKDDLFYRGFFFLAPANWSKTINYIKEKYGKDVVIFHGEGCDSLQNYGFSQFETLFHDNEDFRVYADKMAGYLFSPEFFKKLKDNSFLKDNVYRIFRGLYPDKAFVDAGKLDWKEKIYYYLFSFIFSDIRIPFRKVDYQRYIKDSAFRDFEKWLKEEYFGKVVENISANDLYYWFSYLYTLFHLQSPQIHIYRTGLDNVRFPYIDLNLFRFFYKMPSEFGRGLEFRPTKFVEKEFTKTVLPKELVDMLETGPHSYLYEIEDMNPYDEYLLKGSVYKTVRKKIDINKIRRIFDPKTFKTKEIEKLAEKFKEGKLKNLSAVETKMLLMLSLFSIHPKS